MSLDPDSEGAWFPYWDKFSLTPGLLLVWVRPKRNTMVEPEEAVCMDASDHLGIADWPNEALKELQRTVDAMDKDPAHPNWRGFEGLRDFVHYPVCPGCSLNNGTEGLRAVHHAPPLCAVQASAT